MNLRNLLKVTQTENCLPIDCVQITINQGENDNYQSYLNETSHLASESFNLYWLNALRKIYFSELL